MLGSGAKSGCAGAGSIRGSTSASENMLLLVASADCGKTLDRRELRLRQSGANLAPQFLFASSRFCRKRYDGNYAVCLPERVHRLPQMIARQPVPLGGHTRT